MKIEFVAKPASDAAVLVVLVFRMASWVRGVKLWTATCLVRCSEALPRFKGRRGRSLISSSRAGRRRGESFFWGWGCRRISTALSLRESGGALAGHLLAEFEAGATVLVDGVKGGKIDEEEMAGEIALGALRNYRFDRFLTKPKPDKAPALAHLSLVVTKPAAAQKVSGRLQAIANGVNLGARFDQRAAQ